MEATLLNHPSRWRRSDAPTVKNYPTTTGWWITNTQASLVIGLALTRYRGPLSSRPASALLLARVQAPRAHRQTAVGWVPRIAGTEQYRAGARRADSAWSRHLRVVACTLCRIAAVIMGGVARGSAPLGLGWPALGRRSCARPLHAVVPDVPVHDPLKWQSVGGLEVGPFRVGDWDKSDLHDLRVRDTEQFGRLLLMS